MLYIWGPQILDDLVTGYIFAVFVTTLEAWVKSRFWKLPFSQEPKARADSGRTVILMIMLFLFLPLCGVAHWGASYVPGGTILIAGCYAAMLWGTIQSYRKLRWEQFRNNRATIPVYSSILRDEFPF